MGRMKPVTGVGRVVSYKVEKMGLTDEQLARRLAEAMHHETLRRQDAAGFKTAAAMERVKGREMNGILIQLRERKRNPPVRVRRMDALADYDFGKCEDELALIKDRGKDFERMAAEYGADADKAARAATGYQLRIVKLRTQGKLREAEEIDVRPN